MTRQPLPVLGDTRLNAGDGKTKPALRSTERLGARDEVGVHPRRRLHLGDRSCLRNYPQEKRVFLAGATWARLSRLVRSATGCRPKRGTRSSIGAFAHR
jgi:hypothetical protein